MKLPFIRLLALSAGVIALPVTAAPVTLSPLDQLTGPIALYPDPLIALILPASTVPADIASAARYLGGDDDPSQIDSQPWDPSVRGLAHYPNVLEWMAQNLDWTVALGNAFASQPASVMDSIQRLRAMAQAAGTLVNTPQQAIVEEGSTIAIVPADPEMIYVPSYDPAVVYEASPYDANSGPWITFGVGFPVGFWLGYDFDWQNHAIWYGDWRNWRNDRGWGHPVFPGQRGYINSANTRQWRPAPTRTEPVFSPSPRGWVVRPQPMPGAPGQPEPRSRWEGAAEARPGFPAPGGWHQGAPQNGSHFYAAPAHPKPNPPPSRNTSPPKDDKKPDPR